MKRILICISALLFSACGDDFLDLAPESQASADGFYKTATDLEQGVIAAYDALQAGGQYGRNFVYFMEVSADNATVGSVTTSGGIYGDFEIFRVVPTNTVLQETWQDCYAGIQRCNIVLNRIDAVEMEEQLKSVRKGEVMFIRALTYFNLVRIWGDMPLVIAETQNPFDAFAYSRTPVSEIYTQIVEDLKIAIDMLPVAPKEAGRVTQGAARTLLAEIYLTRLQYAEAAALLKAVIDSKAYELLPSFADVFSVTNKNNKESVFEIQFLKGGKGEGSEYVNRFSPMGTDVLNGGIGSSNGDNVPTRDLLRSFDANDKRLPVTIDSVRTQSGLYYTRKYVDTPFQDGDSNNDFIVYRYADVLLLYAEALNNVGYQAAGDAFDYLNEVRVRAGLNTLTAEELPDQESFQQAIAIERRHELAFENHRWFDLLRTGKTQEVLNGKFSFSVQPHQLVFPIPQREIDTAPDKIGQNKDYQ